MVVDLIGVGSGAIVIHAVCRLVRTIWMKEREIRWHTAMKKRHRRATYKLSADNTRKILRLRRSVSAPAEPDDG